jgi:hypothetical protein
VTPKWIGVQGIYNTLTDMKTKLQTISLQVDNTFLGDDFLRTDPTTYYNSLDTLYNKYQSSTLNNPNPTKDGLSKPTGIPSYIKVIILFNLVLWKPNNCKYFIKHY